MWQDASCKIQIPVTWIQIKVYLMAMANEPRPKPAHVKALQEISRTSDEQLVHAANQAQ